MAYSQAELERAAMEHFQCLPSVAGSGREDRATRVKRERVASVTKRYRRVMDENPGMDREDAIRLTVGAFRLIVGFLFPWIGLAMSITAWLWDFEHSSEIVPNAGQ